jgi:hypothetical protein
MCKEAFELSKENKLPKTVSTIGPVKTTALDILGPLPETKNENRFLLII